MLHLSISAQARKGPQVFDFIDHSFQLDRIAWVERISRGRKIAIGFDMRVRTLPDWWIWSDDCKLEQRKAVKKKSCGLDKVATTRVSKECLASLLSCVDVH